MVCVSAGGTVCIFLGTVCIFLGAACVRGGLGVFFVLGVADTVCIFWGGRVGNEHRYVGRMWLRCFAQVCQFLFAVLPMLISSQQKILSRARTETENIEDHGTSPYNSASDVIPSQTENPESSPYGNGEYRRPWNESVQLCFQCYSLPDRKS